MDFQITPKELWKTTVASSKITLNLLSAFDGNECDLIKEAIEPLKRLVECGEDFEYLRYSLPEPAKQLKAQLPTKSKTTVSATKSANVSVQSSIQRVNGLVHDTMEPDWEKLDERTISVSLGQNRTIICIAVTTEAQLEAIIPEIRAAEFITLDCEFLAMKKEIPMLKLIQIAVSKEKGYAIQVDLVGREEVSRHLKPILEDDRIGMAGWAFKGDAMAIECYIKDIRMASVLDLQAKLRPVAIEELSLNSAVAKYASHWEGCDAFLKIKQFRNNFSFSAADCIWTKDPLPAKALVYSIFDVVCVYALTQSVSHFENSEKFYWPLTVTNGASRKALDRWQQQRVTARNWTPPVEQIEEAKNVPVQRGYYSKKKKFAPAPDIYDDNDPQYVKDINDALKRSILEFDSSVPIAGTSDRNEDECQNTVLQETGDDWRMELEDKQDAVYFSKENRPAASPVTRTQTASDKDDNKTGWGSLESSPQSATNSNSFKDWPFARNNNVGSVKSAKSDRAPPQLTPSPKTTSIPLKLSRSPVPASSYFQSKPEREKYSADLKYRIPDSQNTGKFSWDFCKPEEMAEESWSKFAMESESLWGKGKDADLNASPVISSASTPPVSAATTSPHKPKAANGIKKPVNTSTSIYNIHQNIGDSWDVIDEKPRTMEMAMNHVPIRSNFTGPKVNNPYDDEFDDDDDDDNDDTAKKNEMSNISEDSPTFVEDIYLNDSLGNLPVHRVDTFEQLDMINIPKIPYLAAITYSTTRSERTRMMVKALQIYIIADSMTESYTVVLDQACLVRDNHKIPGTKFGYLLTSPEVKRIVWYISYVQDTVKERLGFYIGKSIDVSHMVFADLEKEQSFHQAATYYLKNWEDWDTYIEEKTNQDKAALRSFGYAPWDEKKLRISLLVHSAFCGLILYKIYKSPKSIDHVDENEFIS